MSPKESWEGRLSDMSEAAQKITDYAKSIESIEALLQDQKTIDACVRNLQIVGDAAKHIPAEIKKELSQVPWREIQGMRNILVHEYFATNNRIIWSTIKRDIPLLLKHLKELQVKLDTPVHPWRICAPGEHFVRDSSVDAYLREGHPVRAHPRREHCRRSASTVRDTLSAHEIQEISASQFKNLAPTMAQDDLGFGDLGTKFDQLIEGWTKYWNEVMKPDTPLDAALVKALIASESSFQKDSGKTKRKSAKGLAQLMPTTLRYLSGQKGELKDFIFTFDSSDVFDPNFNIASGVRWLFRKKDTATARLGRVATWEEAVAEYKDYLRRKLKNPSVRQKGMEVFNAYYTRLKKPNR